MARKITDKAYLDLWDQYRDNISKATPVDLFESAADKKKRIERLEKDPEEWFRYYFPNFYTHEPTDWHKAASRRVINNPEWYEVRSWSRELAKSARTMMEVLYLTITSKKSNVMLTSNTKDNAERLLLPYKSILEANNRIINDYGKQESIGNWESHEFITRKGVAFRAIGSGQSPRGSRNEAIRPDVLLIDDIDTDKDCKNPDIIKERISWIESALIPTRSISASLLTIVCGNIIAEYCCVTALGEKADKWETINIRDSKGKSTWPQKNTEEMIDRVLKTISYNAQQREYFNNPIIDGDTFERITYGKTPAINTCDAVVAYFDPSTSNKDKPRTSKSKGASFKAGLIVGYKNHTYYVYWIRIQQTGNQTFVNWIFDADQWLKDKQVDPRILYIENNSLQAPHYEQVIKPAINIKAREERVHYPPLREDKRKKADKYDRVEGTLQPIDAAGNLIFDEKLKGNDNMKVMEGQMLAVSPNAKQIDGPDCLEGGVWLMQNRQVRKETTYRVGVRESRKF